MMATSRTIPHDESLVRPEASGLPSAHTHENGDENDGRSTHAELVCFNAFFCPYAQMAWIALNEKGVADRTEFVEGLTIRGGDYEVHPRLRKLGHSGVPTLYHPASDTVVTGSTHCIAYVDKNFGEPHQLLPKDKDLRKRALHCEAMLHSVFTFPFYSMLLRQEEHMQEKAKADFIKAVEKLLQGYRGPFYLGNQFSVADAAIAPYFDRMIVLEHYRNFRVPQGGSTGRWHEWRRNVLSRPSVAATRQDRGRIIEAYLRYAKCYVRNNWYERVFYRGY